MTALIYQPTFAWLMNKKMYGWQEKIKIKRKKKQN